MAYRLAAFLFLTLLALPESSVAAQGASAVTRRQSDPGGPGAATAGLPEILGPPAPLPPEMARRDDGGKVTMRAVRVASPIKVDGRLDEAVYTATPAVGGFVEQFPQQGVPATEPTDIWVLFDDDTLYVSGFCYESEPSRQVATELRRDSSNIFQGDNITLVLDTFYDRRNGFLFQTNPIGAIRDQAISEAQLLNAWNTVWTTWSVRTPKGWSFEMAIPFKSLRYRRPGPQVWGINVLRRVKWKNEVSLLAAVPQSYANLTVSQMHEAGTLVGVETPGLAKNLEVKPYGVVSLTTDETASPPYRNHGTGTGGVDLKYGLSSGLTADVTVNTDFAQVEEDLQQVNLTRFSLQFPEKRDFFLEGQGIFAFGDRTRLAAGTSDVPIVFFSRQIGLSKGQAVPVRVGGRVTGKAGKYDIGLLDIQTGEKTEAGAAPTNFSVVRVKRDVWGQSSIGMIAAGRLPTSGGRSNVAGGLDAAFRFNKVTTASGYYALTSTPGVSGRNASYRARFDWATDNYGLAAEHLLVDPNFNPEAGFVRRSDFRKSYAQARLSHRTVRNRVVRRLSWLGSVEYITNAAVERLEDRTLTGTFEAEFHSGDTTSVDVIRLHEFLPANFRIAPGVVVPTGSYASDTVRGAYTLGQQRKVSGTATVAWGSFYNGTKAEATYSGRVTFGPRFVVEPGLTLNWARLPFGDFNVRLITSRFIVTPTPQVSVTGLVQVNSTAKTMSSSVRFRWEYRPGSELFVAYSDGRDTSPTTPLGLLNRSIAIKVTRLLRF